MYLTSSKSDRCLDWGFFAKYRFSVLYTLFPVSHSLSNGKFVWVLFLFTQLSYISFSLSLFLRHRNPLWTPLMTTDNICSRYLTESGEHYLRHSNESLEVVGSDISHNNGEALYVDSPHWSLHESNISEITFVINGSLVTDNGRGLLQFSR